MDDDMGGKGEVRGWKIVAAPAFCHLCKTPYSCNLNNISPKKT